MSSQKEFETWCEETDKREAWFMIKHLQQQLADLTAVSIELRKWVADGEFSDDVGMFLSYATPEYIIAVGDFDKVLQKII